MEIKDLFEFETFFTPKLIKLVYWFGLAFITLAVLTSIAGISFLSNLTERYGDNSGPGGGTFLFVLFVGIGAAFVWRLICEAWLLFFMMNERLGTLIKQGEVATNQNTGTMPTL